jgi:hypothetical protein
MMKIKNQSKEAVGKLPSLGERHLHRPEWDQRQGAVGITAPGDSCRHGHMDTHDFGHSLPQTQQDDKKGNELSEQLIPSPHSFTPVVGRNVRSVVLC